MSNAAQDSRLTIVVAGNGAQGATARCLVRLDPPAEGVDVVLCLPARDDEIASRFPFVRIHVREGALVPELWRDGIEQTSAPFVALTITPMLPDPGWVEAIRGALREADAVGGAIEPASGLRPGDWAEFFCRYAHDLLPLAAEPSLSLPGDNAGYRRESLLAVADSWREGFWEPQVHTALDREGRALRRAPAAVVRMGRSAGLPAFLRQRLVHGRVYGRARGREYSPIRNALAPLLAPVVPPLLILRRAGAVLRRRRYRTRFVIAIPLMLVLDTAWAIAEARGHLDVLRGR